MLVLTLFLALPGTASAYQYLRYNTDDTYQVPRTLDLSNLAVGRSMEIATDYSNGILITDDTQDNIVRPKIYCTSSSPYSMSARRIPSGNPDYKFELRYNSSIVDCRPGAPSYYFSTQRRNHTMTITPMKLLLFKVGNSGSTASIRYPEFQMCAREVNESESNTSCWKGQRQGLRAYRPSSYQATVKVIPPIQDTSLTKAFSPTTIEAGETATLTLTIAENTQNDLQDNTISFTDTLRSGLTIATPANVNNTCTGGTVTADDGSTTISVANTILRNGTPSCSISVDVTTDAEGDYINGAADISSLSGVVTSSMTDQTLATVAKPVIVNIDSTQNLSKDEAAKVILAPGTYTVNVIGQGDGGAYDAWLNATTPKKCDANGENCAKGWEHKYSYIVDGSPRVIVDRTDRFATPEQALANPPAPQTITLTQETEVSFFVVGKVDASNNQGGVSLEINKA